MLNWNHSNISGKLQNLAPKFGATGRELIFEEENFSGNLQDLIENLHTLNMLASNITHIDKPNLNKVDTADADTDKGRSIEEDFVFNDNALGSVDNLEDYKDDLDTTYGLDDPNKLIGIDDVIASVTIRVDDNEEDKDISKQDTTKEKKAEVEANAGEGLLKKNETDGKGKWVWRIRRESGKTKRKSNSLTVRDGEIANKEIEGEDIDGQGRVKRGEGVDGHERKSEEAQPEIQRQEDGFGKKRERVRRQVLDAVLVPCKIGQLCIISGQLWQWNSKQLLMFMSEVPQNLYDVSFHWIKSI